MSYRIQPFSAAYQSQVVDLITRVLQQEFGYPVDAATRPDLYDIQGAYWDKDGGFWLAFRGTEVVGTIGLASCGDGRGYLKRMYVDASCRGHGIGRRLLAVLLDFARDHNYHCIYIATVPEMEAANYLYETSGFHRIDALPPDIPPYEDTVFYEMMLAEH